MALLPPIPKRPIDRPETWTEHNARRGVIAMHRGLLDELRRFLKNPSAMSSLLIPPPIRGGTWQKP